MTTLLGDYQSLLKAFKEAGYKTRFFSDALDSSHQLLLRHDIDFDCNLAEELAKTEIEENVTATYFFLASSDSYNLLSQKNASALKRISEMGHKIGLHFDPTCYQNIESGLKSEVEIIENHFDLSIDIISLHRPSERFIQSDELIAGYSHTYQHKFIRDIKYYSDSGGIFKFGHPMESQEFKERENIHLLIHPIWWTLNGSSAQTIMEKHLQRSQKALQNHIAQNCKAYTAAQ